MVLLGARLGERELEPFVGWLCHVGLAAFLAREESCLAFGHSSTEG